MKSSSITGLAYSFIPGDTADQKTLASVASHGDNKIVSANNFYIHLLGLYLGSSHFHFLILQ